MLRNIKKRSEGFTIIEVLIVLAIAGLIMLIVFLAVPALQRNQRNNARNSEASRIAASVTECLSNRNGDVDSCNTGAEIDPGTMQQFPTTTSGTPPVTTYSLNFQTNPTGTAPTSSTVLAGVWFGRRCNSAGSAVDSATAGISTREFVVLYTLEPSVTRCISS